MPAAFDRQHMLTLDKKSKPCFNFPQHSWPSPWRLRQFNICKSHLQFGALWGWKKTLWGKTTRHWLWRLKDISTQPGVEPRLRGTRITTMPPILNQKSRSSCCLSGEWELSIALCCHCSKFNVLSGHFALMTS